MKSSVWTAIGVVGMMAGTLAVRGAETPAATGATAQKEDSAVTASADVSVLNAYVWRGQVLTDKAVAQPEMIVGKSWGPHALTLASWGNYNFTDDATGHTREFSEVDLNATYTYSAKAFEVSGGILEYLFPNQTIPAFEPFETTTTNSAEAMPGTRELFVTAKYTALPIVPALSVYRDIDAVDSFYFNGALSFEQPVIDTLKLGIYGSVGYAAAKYNEYYFGEQKDAFNDGNLGATLTYEPALAPGLSIVPGVQYTYILDPSIRDNANELYDHKSMWVAGIKANYDF